MNNKGKTSSLLIPIWILVGFVILGGAYLIYSQSTVQQTVVGTQTIDGTTVSSTLLGKSATLSLNARDQSADDITTRKGVPVYILDPSGNWAESGGTSTSSSASQDFTSGIVVSEKPYKATAFNNTYGSVNGLQEILVSTQGITADIPVYTISGSLEITLFDVDDSALIKVGGANLTLGAGETQQFNKLRIKNNLSNTGYRVYSIYMDLDQNTNVSSISINDAKVESEGSAPLSRVTTDDKTWKFKSSEILYEYKQVELTNIAVQSDGDGTSGESYTLNIVDGEYYFSSKGEGVKFGAETDSTTPTDVGTGDKALAGYFL